MCKINKNPNEFSLKENNMQIWMSKNTLDCNPRVLFFKMGFWVGVNSKNASKSGLFDQKVGVYSRKTPKAGLFNFLGLYSRVGLQSSGYGIPV